MQLRCASKDPLGLYMEPMIIQSFCTVTDDMSVWCWYLELWKH